MGVGGVRALVGDTKSIKATNNPTIMVACRQISERLWPCCGSHMAYGLRKELLANELELACSGP